MLRATIILALLLLGGCVTDSDKSSAVAVTASPKRYDVDPDRPKQVCESTSEGTEAKQICY